MYGDRLRMLRKEKGLKQSELAEIVGISTQRISLYENGREADYGVLVQLADYFDVMIDYLVERVDYRTIKQAMEYQEVTDALNEITPLISYHWEYPENVDLNDMNLCDRVIKKDSKEIACVSEEDFAYIRKTIDDYAEFLINKYKK